MDWELICWYTRYALMSIYSCALMYVFYLFFMFSNLTFKARCFFDFFSYTGYTDISGLLQNKSAEALINLCIERREKVLKLCCTVRYCLVIVAIKQMRVVPFPFELWEEMCCFMFLFLHLAKPLGKLSSQFSCLRMNWAACWYAKVTLGNRSDPRKRKNKKKCVFSKGRG